MSRSRSPNYRRFPWEEPDFDPRKVIKELNVNPRDRSHHFRGGPEEHGDLFRGGMYPEGQRRSSPFSDDPWFGRQQHSGKEFYRWSSSPLDGMRNKYQRDNRGFDNRHGEDFQRFEKMETFPQSPQELSREGLLHTSTEAGMSCRKEEQGRGRGRFRDFSMRTGDQRAGDMERERRSTQGSFRGRQRGNPHDEQEPHFKRPRREMDDISHFGYGKEEDFGDRGCSADRPRGGFGGRARWNSGSRLTEPDRGITDGGNAPRFDHFKDRRHHEPDFDRQRSPHSVSSSQDRFRTSDGRLENTQDHHFQDSRDSNYHKNRRSPDTVRYGNQGDSVNSRGSWRYDQGQGGRMGPPRNQSRHQDVPHDEQRKNYRPFRGDLEHPVEKESNWAGDRRQLWEAQRPRSLERNPPRVDLDLKMPHQRERGSSEQKPNNVTVIREETLTIKVDMSRPVNQKSSLCYSSDRQLSFDLVNVGRQRLDFLPMLEHSGTYRETPVHTGTFAQEIITLVHFVKEHYFKGDGLTLDKRFSAPQKGGYCENETAELTLNQRFGSSRGFSLKTNSLLDDEDDDDDEILFSHLGSTQSVSKLPLRGPGDLRHDLERRRQEKLEAVKVTILGSSTSQRSHGPISEEDVLDQEGFSNWPKEQNRREGNLESRRGASNRPNIGPQRWNNRFGHQRPNRQNNPAGLSW